MKSLPLLLALLLAPCVHAGSGAHDHAGTPSHTLTVTGAVLASVSLDLASIQRLAPKDTGPMDVVCASGEVKGKVDNYRGVLLTDILNTVGIRLEDHKDDRRMVIVARATDGYTVTFSWSELYNTEVGKQVIVAWEKDGKPLDDGEGQLLLVSGKDIKTGPRRVRWLDRIEVVRM